MDFAAEMFDSRDSFIFYQTGERLTFRELKKKVFFLSYEYLILKIFILDKQAEDLATGFLAIGINKGNYLFRSLNF